MKLNIFSVARSQVPALRAKLESVGMSVIDSATHDNWEADFYYSADVQAARNVPWAKPFKKFFDVTGIPQSRSPFAVYLFIKEASCFAVSYGKAHFYVRPFCDYDFGIELAKRIAYRDDTRQTAAKRFSGRQRKSIRSYSHETHLSVESGESIDYIQAAILPVHVEHFGSVAKFGTSAQVTPEIAVDEIGQFLTRIENVLATPEKFDLPRTTVLTDAHEVEGFDQQLLDELQSTAGTTEFTHNTYDLYGVDFVFGSMGTYTIKWRRRHRDLEQLTIRDLKEFIAANAIPRGDIFKIKIVHHQQDGPSYTSDLKRELDFISDTDRVVLSGGRWMRFNQDYLGYLDEYLRGIKVEETEPELATTYLAEGAFNTSAEVANSGYEVADKDFDIFKTRSATPIEAWDLKRGKTVYAVKFGTAQKLGYVCDQARAVLELMRNKAEIRQIPDFEEYCLWLGYRGKRLPESIADTGSIILKQKIEAWARAAESLGITPVLKLSQRLRRGVDDLEEPEPKS